MGIFSKIKNGLKKPRDSMMRQVEGVLSSFQKIDEELFEELEEILIMSDVGVATSGKICELLRERVKAERITDPAQIKDEIKKLDDRERNIMYLRFMQGKTQMEVAREVGISQAQVSRLEKNALKRIKGE